MEAWFLGAGMVLCLFCLIMLIRRDWVRLTRISRTIEAEVIGHRIVRDSEGTGYAAIYRFSAEGESHEVKDEVLSNRALPPVGAKANLTYPLGRPDLAHVPRPWVWLTVYGLLLLLLGILVAKAMGWLPESGGDIPG